MKRRDFVAGVVSLAVSSAAARPSGKTQRLAVFSVYQLAALMQEISTNGFYRAIFAELRRLGHVEGKNLMVERYGKERQSGGLDALAAEAVRSDPDVIFAIGLGLFELMAATTTIPIVAWSYDPIEMGLTQSLAHPAGNVTGISSDTGPSIWSKRLWLLREIFPAMTRVGFLAPNVPGWRKFLEPAVRAACEAAQLPLVTAIYDLPPSDAAYRQAIVSAARNGANAIMIADNTDIYENRVLIADLIKQARLPAIYAVPGFVEVGGLMAFEADYIELCQRVAVDIDAILRGAKASDIPFYRGAKFDLTINLQTAKELGLTVPPALLAQANEVIE